MTVGRERESKGGRKQGGGGGRGLLPRCFNRRLELYGPYHFNLASSLGHIPFFSALLPKNKKNKKKTLYPVDIV